MLTRPARSISNPDQKRYRSGIVLPYLFTASHFLKPNLDFYQQDSRKHIFLRSEVSPGHQKHTTPYISFSWHLSRGLPLWGVSMEATRLVNWAYQEDILLIRLEQNTTFEIKKEATERLNLGTKNPDFSTPPVRFAILRPRQRGPCRRQIRDFFDTSHAKHHFLEIRGIVFFFFFRVSFRSTVGLRLNPRLLMDPE